MKFSGIYILNAPTARKVGTAGTLPKREALLRELIPYDAGIKKGEYQLQSLPGKRTMVLSGRDIKAFRNWEKAHQVPFILPRLLPNKKRRFSRISRNAMKGLPAHEEIAAALFSISPAGMLQQVFQFFLGLLHRFTSQ